MAGARIRKGDSVVVLSGKDKGRHRHRQPSHAQGRQAAGRGINVMTRHRKPSQANPQSGIDRVPAPMPIGKVALADPKDGRPTRVRFEERDGRKVRVAVKSGETIDG